MHEIYSIFKKKDEYPILIISEIIDELFSGIFIAFLKIAWNLEHFF